MTAAKFEPLILSVWGLALNWATLFLGDINMGTWPFGSGESQMRQEYMVMGPAGLFPASDCTASYRPILSSERAPYMKKQELVRLKKKKKLNLVMVPKGGSYTKKDRPIDSGQ
jgi:hypothetical protein